jgi:hypothetical protein
MTVVIVRRDEQIRDVAVLPDGRPVMLKGINVLDDVAAARDPHGVSPVAATSESNVLAGIAASGEPPGDPPDVATPKSTEEHDASSSDDEPPELQYGSSSEDEEDEQRQQRNKTIRCLVCRK